MLAGKSVQIKVKSKKKKLEGQKEIWPQPKPKKNGFEYDITVGKRVVKSPRSDFYGFCFLIIFFDSKYPN
jgi:hypothetical protein